MNNLSITISFVVIALKIITSASLTIPPVSQKPTTFTLQTTSTNIDILQPRNIFFDTITPPLQSFFDYLMKSFSLFSDIMAKMFIPKPSTPLQQNTSTKVSKESIPVQNFQKDIIVEGTKGNIVIDGKPKYHNDKAFQKGEVHVQIRDGNFYVNDNLVAKKDPTKSSSIYWEHNFLHYEVGHFELKIYANGTMKYEDDVGGEDIEDYIEGGAKNN